MAWLELVIIVWTAASPFSAEEEPGDKDNSEEENTGGMKNKDEKVDKEECPEEPVEFPDTVVEMSHIGGAQWVFDLTCGLVWCSCLSL